MIIIINKQLYGVEIRIRPLENLQKDKTSALESSSFFHVPITKHCCDKLLCKLMLDGVWTNYIVLCQRETHRRALYGYPANAPSSACSADAAPCRQLLIAGALTSPRDTSNDRPGSLETAKDFLMFSGERLLSSPWREGQWCGGHGEGHHEKEEAKHYRCPAGDNAAVFPLRPSKEERTQA